MAVAGTWDVSIKTPMGDQKGTFAVVPQGDAFTGQFSSPLGDLPVSGRITGETLTWQMGITTPMALTLDCEATATGDTLTGTVTAGMFGAMPLAGVRKG